MLKGEDLLRGVMFEDAVALCAHPMDIHKPDSTQQVLKEFDSAGSIPYRCMYAEGFPNILAAGRIISADADSYASIRVQATCMALGQAAGTAAGLCSRRRIYAHELPVRALRNSLRSAGAIL